MCTAKAMAETYEANRQICKYVHSTSRGHEAIQLATAFHLLPCDYVSPYYRDESLMLGLGFEPFTLMLQLLAKGNDIFTGGREYYNHPNYKKEDKPTIIHQSSATGMQAIPTTGIAQGLKFLAQTNNTLLKKGPGGEMPVVICSLGDASVTEGEVSEAFQFAALHQLPIIYLVQDNDWGISVTGSEARTTTAFEFIEGFKGIERVTVDGSNFEESFNVMQQTIAAVRKNRKPWLVHAKVPLLGHHTSGVRKETYRSNEDLQKHFANDPVEKLKNQLLQSGINAEELEKIEEGTKLSVQEAFEKTVASPEPDAATVSEHIFAETAIIEEKGERSPAANKKIVMVDAALFAIREIMEDHPEALLYGQDVGRRLGGVFREAATLAEQFGDNRVFNTAIQEAYIIGSTVGMSAVGLKPIVEVQFADYIYPGLNQLVTEISKSCYLSCGKFPVQTLIRVPIGAYGGGGPYHSGSVESTLLTFKGIKVVYPSNAADMKGLLKAAFYDPNPVVMLEHKGLYWSKVAGTEEAMQIEPSRDYIVPLGKANIALTAAEEKIANGESCCIITYGMGVFWARVAAKNFNQSIEVIDLRTLFPLDEELVFTRVKKHGKCLILTEEQQNNSFAEALAGRVSKACFQQLDAPVEVLGALNLPAVPMNLILENAMLPNAEKVTEKIKDLLKY
ncbi:MAG: tungsten formylmethanofuran dehydrogenase [Chitinophagaceae bacterium]|jgi:2-oxoisovalerate dehydrogenase E1 component|nr:tungsten formylmethanofuran dehydrogenase [Chitinophagaceae bacterium]MBP6046585.1 tungsten formylmethanofuran dehydrogenase [Ferruginibacter sp.]NMD28272.1 tungsten formylmethanofuran dehydrogenase [Bacteroidota bacterium]MBK7734127.1 tungsten formylmethanofuran dehydrogenase [Chitinophagaceae bacterium]MBK8929245.1 tungsten formylmethanofuran dehydrogenase [Chitinophagaceae bacterium]